MLPTAQNRFFKPVTPVCKAHSLKQLEGIEIIKRSYFVSQKATKSLSETQTFPQKRLRTVED